MNRKGEGMKRKGEGMKRKGEGMKRKGERMKRKGEGMKRKGKKRVKKVGKIGGLRVREKTIVLDRTNKWKINSMPKTSWLIKSFTKIKNLQFAFHILSVIYSI